MSTVQLTWSTSNGGVAIEDDVDFSSSNGAASSASTIYLRHDGSFSITGCKLYIAAISERYEGDFTADADLSEILGWGNATDADEFGGLFINLNATGSFPVASWPTVSSKSPSYGAVCRTGTGDSASNGISLLTQSGCTATGEIQTGASPNVRFQTKFYVPTNEDSTGTRHIKQVLSYTYTS